MGQMITKITKLDLEEAIEQVKGAALLNGVVGLTMKPNRSGSYSVTITFESIAAWGKSISTQVRG